MLILDLRIVVSIGAILHSTGQNNLSTMYLLNNPKLKSSKMYIHPLHTDATNKKWNRLHSFGMQTIEHLCKCKDVVDLLYMYVHRALTRQLLTELKVLSKKAFYFSNDAHALLYNEENHLLTSCFNWRDLQWSSGERCIYHVYFEECRIKCCRGTYTVVRY